MSSPRLSYHAVFAMGRTTWPATGLIVVQESPGPLRAVIWSHRQQAWMWNPMAAAPLLMDDQKYDQQTPVPRSKADEIARSLGTELPSEETLHRMCEAGATESPPA